MMELKQFIKSAKLMSPKDRAFLAHCLISSLDESQEQDSEQLWADLAEKRYKELIAGKVKSVSWEDIKKEVKDKKGA